MWNNFFKHIDIDPSNVHILDGNAANLQAECESYEMKIKEAGGIHLFIGGKQLYGLFHSFFYSRLLFQAFNPILLFKILYSFISVPSW